MKKNITILALIAIAPLGLYFYNFHYGPSNDASDWASFGSYVGGVYGALAFFAVAYSIYLTRSQFVTQYEDDVFYRSVESLKSGLSIKHEDAGGDFVMGTFAKNFVVKFQKELENKSSHMARKILCNKPSLISYTNIEKIVNSINLRINIIEKQIDKDSLLKEVGNRQGFEEKWEYLKSILGGIGAEDAEVKSALNDAGSVSFYGAKFGHREYYYDLAWGNAEQKYSEDVSIYLRRFDFILCHVMESKRSLKYKKYLLSQLSKYDMIFYIIMRLQLVIMIF